MSACGSHECSDAQQEKHSSILEELLRSHGSWLDARKVQAASKLAAWMYTESSDSDSRDGQEEAIETTPEGMDVLAHIPTDVAHGQHTSFSLVKIEALQTIFCVWMGTKKLRDWLSNFDSISTIVQDCRSLNAHNGFWGLASNDAHKLLESFREHLSDPGDGWSLYFCGHSMGAAVANVVWLMMQLAGSGKGPLRAKASGLEWLRDRSFATCLASPMVFQKSEPVHEDDVPLLERMRWQCLTFVNGNDVVPRVPGHPSYAKTHLRSFTSGRKPRFIERVVESFVSAYVEKLQEGTPEEMQGFEVDCARYSHLSLLLHFLPKQTRAIESEELQRWEFGCEAAHGGSVVSDHDVGLYLAKVAALAEVKDEGADEVNTVARLTFALKASQFFSWMLRPQHVGILKFQSCQYGLQTMVQEGRLLEPTSIASFCGNSTNGKSYIISKLLHLSDSHAAAPRVFPPGELKGGATSGDVSMWKWQHRWLMDCEGTNGTSMPAVMSKVYRMVSQRFPAVVRSDKVRKCLPPFALLTANVFCYVITEGPHNETAYKEVLAYAYDAWAGVQTTVRPSLVVIQNKVGTVRELKSFEESTSSFKQRDSTGELAKMFLNIHFVQLPPNDEETFVRGGKSFAYLFKERLQQLDELLNQLILVHHQQQKEHDAVITQALWVTLLPQVIASIDRGQPVNMSALITSSMVPHDQFFADVWEVMKILLRPGIFNFGDREGMVKYVLHVLDCVECHAATLMVKADHLAQVSQDVFKEKYGKAWADILPQIQRNIPCCAVKADKGAPYNICAQPKSGHDTHSSLYHEEVPNMWYVFGGKKGKRAVRWAGGHECDQAIETKMEQLQTSVFDKAADLSAKLHSNRSTHGHGEERIRQYWKDKHAPVINILKGNDVCCMARHASNMQSCLLCAAPFVYRSWYSGLVSYFRGASNSVLICKTCGLKVLGQAEDPHAEQAQQYTFSFIEDFVLPIMA